MREHLEHANQRSNQVSVWQDQDIFPGGPSGLFGKATLGEAKSERHHDTKAHTRLARTLQVCQDQAVDYACAATCAWSLGSSLTQVQD